MRRGQRKALYTRRRNPRGPKRKQKYSVRLRDKGKFWPSAKMAVECDPKKSWSEVETEMRVE